ncbi:hypothetical protein ABZP36_025646 [Zizania latifolia]
MAALLYLALLASLSFQLCSCAYPWRTMTTGSHIRAEDHGRVFLLSPDTTFSCGFHQLGTNAFTFSIWYTNTTEKTVVWTANPYSPATGYFPVNLYGSRVSLGHDGNLVLTDTNGTTVWESKTLTKDERLVSGYHHLYFDNDNVLRLLYDGPEITSIYWPSPDYNAETNGRTRFNSTRIAFLDDTGNFVSSDGFKIEATDSGPGIKRRITIDYDGNFRMYSLNESTGSWTVTGQAVIQMCYVHGLCGKNGICDYAGGLRCRCPQEYVMVDPTDWNKGCRPTFTIDANESHDYMFVKQPHADFYGFDLGSNKSISFEACQGICLNSSSCMSFTYKAGGGLCYTKGLLYNGQVYPYFPGDSYMKVPKNLSSSTPSISNQENLTCNPSGSEIMLGSAKGKLICRGNPIDMQKGFSTNSMLSHQPQQPDEMAKLLYPVFLSVLSVHVLSCCFASPWQTISTGTSLQVDHGETFLVSPDTAFSCGFYSSGKDTNAYYFSIWFTHATDRTVVWTADSSIPVNGHGSKISLSREGNLVLADVNGSTVWESKTGWGKHTTAALLNSGNLVIRAPDDRIVWQSFDWPTDTLLPSQRLTREKRLVSPSGYHVLYFDNDNVLRLLYNGDITSIYWPSPDYNALQNGRTRFNSSKIAVLDDEGNFISSDGFKMVALDSGLGIRRRITMDYDGNFRMYSLDPSTGNWKVTGEGVIEMCYVHGLCGKNGICEYSPGLRCTCPPGYEMTDPENWSKGCRPTFSISCSKQREDFTFIQIPHGDFYGFDLSSNKSISFQQCMQICLESCECSSFTYKSGGGLCYTKDQLYNGQVYPYFPGDNYIKLPKNTASASLASKQPGLTCNPNGDKVMFASIDAYRMNSDNIRVSGGITTDEEEDMDLTQFVQVVKQMLASGADLDIVDNRLKGHFNFDQAKAMLKIGVSCLEERSKRPTMDQIVKDLMVYDDEDYHPEYI